MTVDRSHPSLTDLHSKSFPHTLQPKRSEYFFQPFSGSLAWQILELRDDQFILHRVLPADQLCHGDFVAIRFEQQAAQHVGDLATEFAGVDRVTP